MFRWLNLRAKWSAPYALEQLRRGNVPRRVLVRGSLDLGNAAWLTYLPVDLEAAAVDVSQCVNLRGLPERLKCEELIVRRTNIVSLPQGLQVWGRIIASNCRNLQRVSAIHVPEL